MHKLPGVIKSDFIIQIKKSGCKLLKDQVQEDDTIILSENDIKRTIFFAPETDEFKKRYMNDYDILSINKTKNLVYYLNIFKKRS